VSDHASGSGYAATTILALDCALWDVKARLLDMRIEALAARGEL
jgi:L-alanine-DL-glutamate epimerase-like enolase superfamily enzyme